MSFSKSSICTLIVLLVLISCIESKAFYRRLYGGDFKDRPIDRTATTKTLFGDIMCDFCKKTNNATCIIRYCEDAAIKDISSGPGGVDIEKPSIALLGDALCQFCILTNNATCIARYCNDSPQTAIEPVQEPTLQRIDIPITDGIEAPLRAVNKRSIRDHSRELEHDITNMIEDIVNSYDEH